MNIHMIEDRENSSMRSLERTLHILEELEKVGSSINVTQLANAVRLSRPTVLRILSVLEKYGYVSKRQGGYRLGVAVLPLAYAFSRQDELTKAALPVLQELARTSEETASLFVRLKFKRILIQRIDGIKPLRFLMTIGQKLPIHMGAGKVLAAALPNEEFQKLLDEMEEIPLASGGHLTREILASQIDNIRRRGYSVSQGERIIGTFSIGAPIVDAYGATIAAVSVAGDAESLTPEKTKWLCLEVRRSAIAISERYGGMGGH